MVFGFGSFASAPWASLPDAPAAKVSYTLSCATGSYIFVGNDATLTYVQNPPISFVKGGIGKTKTKVYKDLRKEVEEDIANAIVKVTGEDKAIVAEAKVVNTSLVVENKAAEEANIAKLQEMVMQAQAMALQAEIDRLIQAELDDEESLMLLL